RRPRRAAPGGTVFTGAARGETRGGFSSLLDGSLPAPEVSEARWQAPDAGSSAPARIGVIVGYDVRDMTEYAQMVASVLARVPEGMPIAIRVVSENARVSEESLRDALKALPNVQSVLVSVEDVFADGADRITLFRDNDVIVTLGAVMAQVGRSNIPLAQAVVHPKNTLNLDAAPVFGYSSGGGIVPDSLRMGEVALEWEDRVRQSAARAPVAEVAGVAAADSPSMAIPATAEAPSSSNISEGTQGPLAKPSVMPQAAPEDLPNLQAVPKAVHGILPKAQRALVQQLLHGPEARFFSDKMRELEALLATIPDLHKTDGQGEDAVVHLHYFTGSADWYITEIVRDPDYAGDAFGLADLGMGFPELGYMSLPEIMEVAELDFHFAPRPLRLVLNPNAEPSVSLPSVPLEESVVTDAPVSDPDSSPEPVDEDSEEGVLFYRGGTRGSIMPAGRTIEEVIDYESNELDHNIQIVTENMAYQKALPPASLQWVTDTPEEASEYGNVREVRFNDPVVMARDVFGGMLVGERTELDTALRLAGAVAVEAPRDLLLTMLSAADIDKLPEALMIETLDMIRDIQQSWPDAGVVRARVTGGEDKDHPVTLGLIMGVFVEPRASGGYGERLDGDRVWIFAGDSERGISGHHHQNKVFYDAAQVADKLRLAAWLKNHGAAFGMVSLRLDGEREILGGSYSRDFVETVQEGADRWLRIGTRTPMTVLLEIENHERYPGDRFTMYRAELADAGRLIDGWHAEHPNTPMLVSVRRGDYSAPLPMAAIADYLGDAAAVVREAGHGTQFGEIKQLQAVDAVVYVGKFSRASHDTGKTFTSPEKEGATKPTWMFTTDKGNITRNMKHDNARWEKWRETEADNARQVENARDQAVAEWVPQPVGMVRLHDADIRGAVIPNETPRDEHLPERGDDLPISASEATVDIPPREAQPVYYIDRRYAAGSSMTGIPLNEIVSNARLDGENVVMSSDMINDYDAMPLPDSAQWLAGQADPLNGVSVPAHYLAPVVLATGPEGRVLVAEHEDLRAYREREAAMARKSQPDVLAALQPGQPQVLSAIPDQVKPTWDTTIHPSVNRIISDAQREMWLRILKGENTGALTLQAEVLDAHIRRVALWLDNPLPRSEAQKQGLDARVVVVWQESGAQRRQYFLSGLNADGVSGYGLTLTTDGEAVLGPIHLPALLESAPLLGVEFEPGPLRAVLRDEHVAPERVRVRTNDTERADKAGLTEMAQESATYRRDVETIEAAGGWDAVQANPALREAYQDQIDHLIQLRAEWIAGAYKEMGWIWSGASFSHPNYEGVRIFPDTQRSAGGGNVLHWGYRVTVRAAGEGTPIAGDFTDDMDLPAVLFAREVGEAAAGLVQGEATVASDLAAKQAALRESITAALQGYQGLIIETSPYDTEILVQESRSRNFYSITQRKDDFRVHVMVPEKEDYEDHFSTLDDAMDFVGHEIFMAQEANADKSSPYYQVLLNMLPGMPEAERNKMFWAVIGVMKDDWTGTVMKRRIVSRVVGGYAAHFPASVTVDQVMEGLAEASTRVHGLDLGDTPLLPASMPDVRSWSLAQMQDSVRSTLEAHVIAHIREHAPMVLGQANTPANSFDQFMLGSLAGAVNHALMDAASDRLVLPQSMRDEVLQVLQSPERSADYHSRIGRMIFDGERAKPAVLEDASLPAEAQELEHLENAENVAHPDALAAWRNSAVEATAYIRKVLSEIDPAQGRDAEEVQRVLDRIQITVNSAVVTASQRMARELGDGQVGHTVAETIYRSAESADLTNAMDALHDLGKTMRERLLAVNQARGKQTMKELPDDAPLAEYAAAVFMAEYGHIAHPDQIERILADIEQRNVDRLLSLIGHNSQNAASQRIFERATGIRLGKTQKERVRQIDAWAGISPEQRRATDSEREADRRHHQRLRDVRDAWEPLSRIRVQTEGSILNAQEFVQKMLADGYTTAVAVKRGAAREYRLMDAERNTRSLGGNRQLNRFLFNVLAVEHGGDIAAAMRLAGMDTVPDLAPSAPLPEEIITPEQAEALNHLFGVDNAPASPLEVAEAVPATSPDQPIAEDPPMATAADTEEDLDENGWAELDDGDLRDDEDGPAPEVVRQTVPERIPVQASSLFSALKNVTLEKSYPNENGIFPCQHTTRWQQGDGMFSRTEVSIARDRQGAYRGALKLPNSGSGISLYGTPYPTFQEAHLALREKAVAQLLHEAGSRMASGGETNMKVALARAVAAKPDGDSIITEPLYHIPPRGDALAVLLEGVIPEDSLLHLGWDSRYQRDNMPTLVLGQLDPDAPQRWSAALLVDNLGSLDRNEDILAVVDLEGTLSDFMDTHGSDAWNSAPFQAVLTDAQREVVASEPFGEAVPQLWTKHPVPEVNSAPILKNFPFWARNAQEGAEFGDETIFTDHLGNVKRYAALKFVEKADESFVTIAVARDDRGFLSGFSLKSGGISRGLLGLNIHDDKQPRYATFDDAARAGIKNALKATKDDAAALAASLTAWQTGEDGPIEPVAGGVDSRWPAERKSGVDTVILGVRFAQERGNRETIPEYSVSVRDAMGDIAYLGGFKRRTDAELMTNALLTGSVAPSLQPWSMYLAQQRPALALDSVQVAATAPVPTDTKSSEAAQQSLSVKPENLPERVWAALPESLREQLAPTIEKLLALPMRYEDMAFPRRPSGNRVLSMDFVAEDGTRADFKATAHEDQAGIWVVERQRLRFTDVFATAEHKVYPFLQKLQAAGLYDQVETVETRDNDVRMNGTPAITMCAIRDRTQLDELVALRGMKPMEVLATVSLTGDVGFEKASLTGYVGFESDGHYATILEKKLREAAGQLDQWKRAYPENPLRLVVVAVDEDGTQQEPVVAARRQMVRDILGTHADVLRVQDDLKQVRFSAAVALSDAVMVIGDPLEDKEAKQWIDKNFRAEDKKKFSRATWVYALAFTELHQEKLVDQVMNRWKYKRIDNEKTAALAQSVPQAIVAPEVPPVRSVPATESVPGTIHAQVTVPAAALQAAAPQAAALPVSDDQSPAAVTAGTETMPTNPEEGIPMKPVRIAMPEEVTAYIEPLVGRVSQHVGTNARSFTMVLDGVVPVHVPTNHFTLNDALEPAHFGFILRRESADMPTETLIDLPPFDVVMNSQIAEIVAERIGASYENRNMKRIGEMMTATTAEAALWRIRNTDQPRNLETGEKVDMTTVKALRTDRQVMDAGVWREAVIVDRQTLLASGDPDALLGDRWVLMADTAVKAMVIEEARNKEVVTATARLVSEAFGGIPMLDGYADRAAAVMAQLPPAAPAPLPNAPKTPETAPSA
ncbi:DUF2958 domain-containing protein, partial [Acidithiobacillus sp. MC6.1]|nr:DUF2958 domain-containing protein [Acidithiobacillus sp. MC6.1]